MASNLISRKKTRFNAKSRSEVTDGKKRKHVPTEIPLSEELKLELRPSNEYHEVFYISLG